MFDPFAIDPSEFKPPPTQGLSQTTGLQTYTASVPEIDLATGQVDRKNSLSSIKRNSTLQSDPPLATLMELDEQHKYPQAQKSSTGLSVHQELPVRSISKKRPIASEEDRANENFDVMDLLPGAQAVKRRKVAEKEERIRRGETIEESPPESELAPKAPENEKVEKSGGKGRGKRAQKEKEKTEDLYVARARDIREREAEEARVAKEEESAAMDGLEVEKMRNLAIVEVMEVKPRTDKPVQGDYGDEGARWDDKWNGRKNFKKFRRQGRGGGMRTMRGAVMVNLVEHKRKDFGIGDGRKYIPVLNLQVTKKTTGYWVGNNEDARSSGKRKPQTRPAADDSDLDQGDAPFQTARSQPARSAIQTQTQTQASGSGTRSQTTPTNITSRGTKRGASAAQARSGGGKKQKTMFLKNESDEDESEDELKFRFKRK